MTNETLYCYIHPNRPTSLRCNRCERPICAEDAVLTPHRLSLQELRARTAEDLRHGAMV